MIKSKNQPNPEFDVRWLRTEKEIGQAWITAIISPTLIVDPASACISISLPPDGAALHKPPCLLRQSPGFIVFNGVTNIFQPCGHLDLFCREANFRHFHFHQHADISICQ